MKDEIKVFAGNSNPALADAVCGYLGVTRGAADVRRFSDGEVLVEIDENVRGGDVFVIQSTCTPVNDNLIELLLMLDAFRRASAKRVTAVVPYYGYARQDRKVAPRVPISAKLVADLITTAGAARVLTMDLHAGQIQCFFNIPVDNLFATPVLLDYLRRRLNHDEVSVVSPDAGGVERARAFAKHIDASLAIIDKRRARANEVAEMHIVGDVDDRIAIVVDDMVDTAGTLVKTASALMENGANAVYACASHAVLSGPAVQNISRSCIKEVVVTNTIPLTEEARKEPKIKVLTIAGLIGRAIQSIHEETSVSKLFL